MGTIYGDGSTDYEKYIRTQGLFALTRGPDDLVNEDELLFQVTHQAMELWLAVCLESLSTARKRLETDHPREAARFLNRASGIVEMLGNSLRHVEAIRPWSYHAIRVTLGKGSGQQSPTFNAMLKALPGLLPPFEGLLKRRGITVDAIQQAPEAAPELWELMTAMLMIDQHFMRLRYVHYQMVQRIIGNKVLSLVGVPASALERHAHNPAFPDLWDCINRTTAAYNQLHGTPGDSGAYIVAE